MFCAGNVRICKGESYNADWSETLHTRNENVKPVHLSSSAVAMGRSDNDDRGTAVA
jgi:hypothetical protein